MHHKLYGLICLITHACNVLDLCWTIPILTEVWGYSKPEQFPNRQVVIQVRFSDPELDDNMYWVLARPGVPLETCTEIPGFDIELFVTLCLFC
jgi:hypothetical protein